MRTDTGFEVENPRELLFGFVRDWYPMYDGVEVPQDNELRITEIALSTMLNSRISGNTGADIWRQSRKDVVEALVDIRAGVDLLDEPGGNSIRDESGISRAITAMCNVRRCKLAVATKILHKKRPGLIPILDSNVESHYHPNWGTARYRYGVTGHPAIREAPRLEVFPRVLADSRLAEDSCEEFQANIAGMGIRDPQSNVSLDHELVLASGVGTLEPKLPEAADQLSPLDGAVRRH